MNFRVLTLAYNSDAGNLKLWKLKYWLILG